MKNIAIRLIVQLVWMALLVTAAFVIGRWSAPVPTDRYELRDSGIIGLVVRLDKQTGETVAVPALPAAAGR